MPTSRRRSVLWLAAVGALAFLLAGLSIADMYVPRPFDGVVLETDAPGRMVVRSVVPGSGAEAAGIRPGDRILGVDREVLRSPSQAAELLNRHRIGDVVAYLVEGPEGLREVQVRLGRRRIGGSAYLYVALLGFLFFGVGVFVLAKQPRLPAARVFFLMSALFMLFLVCRLRPASYSWVDAFVLTTGTAALLLLPATFLYFFLQFPSAIWEWRRDPLARAAGWLARRGVLVPLLYAVPPLVYVATVLLARRGRIPLHLVSGAPAP
ncbi:MAG: PDZ domain-containing protein, partial [Nitrospirae bacterium]